MKVTVVGAGFYGSTLVERIAERGYADEVVMTDIIEDKPQGLALDMLQSRPIEGFETRIVGSNGYAETEGSDVCVITAGLPRKPGMSRMDLLEVNAKIVGDVTRSLVAGSPDAVIIVVSNPLDEMTALCAKVSGFPSARVMGQAGMLDTARFKHFLAERLGTSPLKVEAMTLGSHGDTMVPVPSLVRVDGKPLRDLLDDGEIQALVQRTRDGGAAAAVAILDRWGTRTGRCSTSACARQCSSCACRPTTTWWRSHGSRPPASTTRTPCRSAFPGTTGRRPSSSARCSSGAGDGG